MCAASHTLRRVRFQKLSGETKLGLLWNFLSRTESHRSPGVLERMRVVVLLFALMIACLVVKTVQVAGRVERLADAPSEVATDQQLDSAVTATQSAVSTAVAGGVRADCFSD